MFYEGLVEVLTEASKKLSNKRRKHSNQPGWNDHVAENTLLCGVIMVNLGRVG